VKILLGNFNAKVGREDIFKPTIGNGSPHHDRNDNSVGRVNFSTLKNLALKITMHITVVNYVQYFIQHPAVKLTPFAELIIRNNQCRFRLNRSTTDSYFAFVEYSRKNGNIMQQYISYV
jgi:hypothetical protein